jgi:hypothetical protein
MQNLARCLLKDFMYEQDKLMSYIFKNDKFVLVNRDKVADSILIAIDAVFERYLEKDIFSSIETMYDLFALNQAMCRYSRDVFGEKRLHARILHFKEKYKIQDEDVKELISYEDYGVKVDSCNPYIHRRLACLFYWFATLKPFRITQKTSVVKNDSIYDFFEYHNEFTTYILVMMVLELVNCTIDVHESLPLFRQFMYDLHYRKLSRSALEFFLNHHVFPK